MPAILQRGEAVLTPQATAYLGTSTIAALNAGRRGGGAAAMSDDRIVRELKRLNTRLDEGSALSGVIRGKALRDATLLGI